MALKTKGSRQPAQAAQRSRLTETTIRRLMLTRSVRENKKEVFLSAADEELRSNDYVIPLPFSISSPTQKTNTGVDTYQESALWHSRALPLPSPFSMNSTRFNSVEAPFFTQTKNIFSVMQTSYMNRALTSAASLQIPSPTCSLDTNQELYSYRHPRSCLCTVIRVWYIYISCIYIYVHMRRKNGRLRRMYVHVAKRVCIWGFPLRAPEAHM